jgi:subtilisin-like proprotein convertase family protein
MAATLPVASGAVSAAPAGTQTFCGGGITFNNVLPPAVAPYISTPYPSNINVAGMTGTVTNVIVELQNLSHTFPDDIDLLLVGPNGAKAIIMSDVGGGIDAVNLNITLDDSAATSLPDAGPLVSGTFKPTNPSALVADVFPAPAPAGPYGSTLSTFNVSNPNGTWSLYAVDDTLGDVGSIGNWCLTITTEDTEACTLTCPPNVTQANDANQCGAASVTYPAPTTTGVCGTVECSPPSGSFFFVGTTTVTCISATGSQCSFTVTINNVNCPDNTPDTLLCNATSIAMQADTSVSPYPSSIGVSGLAGVISKVAVSLNNLTHTFPDDIDVLLVGPTGANAIIMSDAGGSADANNVTLVFDDAAASPLSDLGALSSGTFQPTNHAPADTFPAPAPAPSGGSALSVFNGTNPNGVWRLFVRDDQTGDTGSFAGGWCLTITRVNPCTITCPANITVPNSPGQCGATVTFAPSTTGDCGAVGCTPASGSFFPVGATSVTCTTAAGPSCSFSVTVNDNENPVITCPSDQSATAPPGQSSTTVTYPDPMVADNCPGATFVCSPPSGSSFPVGVTTVACTATDASSNQANCTFKVAVSGTFILTTADSFLRNGADNTNEGANERLRIQSSGHNRVVVKFDLSGISTVGLQSATLTLDIAENSNNWGPTGRPVDAHRLTVDWTEGNGRNDVMVGGGPSFRGTGEGVTWECAKDSNIANHNDDCLAQWNGGTFAAATAPSHNHTNGLTGPVSWNVTADVLAGANFGWLIKKQAEGQNGQVRYYSREGAALAGNPNLAPRLVLVFAP